MGVDAVFIVTASSMKKYFLQDSNARTRESLLSSWVLSKGSDDSQSSKKE